MGPVASTSVLSWGSPEFGVMACSAISVSCCVQEKLLIISSTFSLPKGGSDDFQAFNMWNPSLEA